VILAIDQGTTGTTCIVFDDAAQPVGRAYREFTQHFPRPGWVEHDAAEIWEVTHAVAGEALTDAGARPGDLEAVGITNQRETVCVWDPAGGWPLHNAIVWQDRRTAARCEELRAAGLEPLIRERTGLVLDPYFSATKMQWLMENVPGLRARAEDGRAVVGTIDSWLLYKLTGEHLTDASNASRTMLYNITAGRWDPELLEHFGVPERALPRVALSAGVLGHTRPSMLHGHATPVAGVAGDQQAALFGQACVEAGMGKNTYGTGSFVLLNTGSTPPKPAPGVLGTVAWEIEGESKEEAPGWVPGLAGPQSLGAARAAPGEQGRKAGREADGDEGEEEVAREEQEHRTSVAAESPLARAAAAAASSPQARDAAVRAYALEASIFVTGAAVQWLRDGLGLIEQAADSEALASTLEGNDGVYFVPALTGLGSPHWDPHARGTITGLTRGSGRAHLARAALEAIAYQTLDAVRAMEAASGQPLRELRADGGATANGWLMQFQADVLGVPVVLPELTETTALGAAYLAGVGVGRWGLGDVAAAWRERARYEPRMGDEKRAELLAGWHDALARTRNLAGDAR
jgi:glycerol kinase